MNRLLSATALLFLATLAPAEPLYHETFEDAAVGTVPKGMMVLGGAFAVREIDGGRALVLPGEPLDPFSVLFGPGGAEQRVVEGRVYGTSKGRLFPRFGLGLNGVAGYKLMVTPSRRALELLADEEVLAATPYMWTSGSWTRIKVQLAREGEIWRVQGKAWDEREAEPAGWLLDVTREAAPISGRPSLWGAPYAGTPLAFDDLIVSATPQP